MREARRKGRGSLRGRKSNLPDAVFRFEPEYVRHLIQVYLGLDGVNGAVEWATHIVEIAEYECFSDIVTTRNDVLAVLKRQTSSFVHRQALPQALLIVGHLDDQRAFERVLQPLSHHKWDQMTQMKSFR